MPGATSRHALSRYAKIYVCDRCGVEEALESAGLMKKKTLLDWDAIQAVSKSWEDRIFEETEKTVQLGNALLDVTENWCMDPEDCSDEDLRKLEEINRLLGMAVEKAKEMV